MKRIPLLAIISVVLFLFFAAAVSVHAETDDDVKEGSSQAANDIKEDAIKAGKAAVDAGRSVKEGSQKAWKDAKQGVKEVGNDFKKAYEETRDAIRKEISGEGSQTEAPAKDADKK